MRERHELLLNAERHKTSMAEEILKRKELEIKLLQLHK